MELDQLNTRIPKELKKELKKIALREDKDLEDIITEELTKFVKAHGEGNPAHTILQWVDNEEMKAYPTLMKPITEWQDYIEKHLNSKELDEVKFKIQSILFFIEKKIKYGTTQVRAY